MTARSRDRKDYRRQPEPPLRLVNALCCAEAIAARRGWRIRCCDAPISWPGVIYCDQHQRPALPTQAEAA
jgi:hypothetical protein